MAVAAATIRVVLLLAFQPWDKQVEQGVLLVNDSRGYHDLALQILKNESIQEVGEGRSEAYRTPGYPLFVAGGRVFDIDIEKCPHCGGTLKFISAIENPYVIAKILAHLGLSARALPSTPAQVSLTSARPDS